MKTKMTIDIEIALYNALKKQGEFICFEVGINKEIVDCLSWNTNGQWRCYEIKTSFADFSSNAAITFVGNYNYYVIPIELYGKIKHLVPIGIGIYTYDNLKLTCYKKAKKQNLTISEDVLKYSLIKSLYRECEKVLKERTFERTKDNALYTKIKKSDLTLLQASIKKCNDLETQLYLLNKRNFIPVHISDLNRFKEIEKKYNDIKGKVK